MSQGAKLLNLQDIDLEVLRLKAQLEKLPQREELARYKQQLKELSKKLTVLLGRKKDISLELESLQEQRLNAELLKEEKQSLFNQSTEHRLLQTYERELSNLSKQLEKLDFKEQPLKEELKKIELLEAKALKLKETILLEISKLEESLRETAENAIRTIESLVEERVSEVQDIDEELLEHYEDLRVKKNGIAVARLDSQKCSVCGAHFQEGALKRLLKGPALSSCPNCHRMIVVRFEDELDSSECQAGHLGDI